MAISYDLKERIGYQGFLDYPRMGLVEDENTCDLIASLRSSEIKNALSAIRAFQIEAQIAKEAGFPPPENFARFDQSNCEDRLRFVIQYLPAFKNSIDILSMTDFMTGVLTCNWDKTKEEAIKTVVNGKLKFNNGAEVNACEFMTQAIPQYVGVSINGGPGPRIGGGGWDKLISPQQQTLKDPKFLEKLKQQRQQDQQKQLEKIKDQKSTTADGGKL
jgi:hypothetical protein